MLERALVHEPGARANAHRGLASGLQRAPAEEGLGWSAAGALRRAPEFARELRRQRIEYSLQRRTLNQTAPKTGITSLTRLSPSTRPGCSSPNSRDRYLGSNEHLVTMLYFYTVHTLGGIVGKLGTTILLIWGRK